MRIICDVDGIIASILPYWLDTIRICFGVRAEVKDIVRYDLHTCDPLSTLKPWQIYDMLQHKGFILGVPPMYGAKKWLKRLSDDGHEIYFVTARSGSVSMPETLEWFRMHFPWVDRKQIGFFNDKHLIKADVLIDDRVETLDEYHKHNPNATTIGIEYPYNTGTSHLIVPQGKSAWAEIYKTISYLGKRYEA